MADISFLPAYLTVGDDALKRQTVESRLVKRVSTLGDLSFNSDTFDGEKAKSAEIVDACNTMPFASEVRLVTVRNVEKLKKADSEALVSYLKAPNDTTVLALYASSLAKNTRLYKAVAALGKSAIIECSSPKAKDLPALVSGLAKSHGLAITRGAVEMLIEYVGTDTVAIDGELKKIALAHRGNDSVNESEIAMMVAHTAELKPWDFVDALSANNKRRCIYCLNHMDSVSSFTLLSMSVSRIRELLITQCLMKKGEQSQLAEVLGVPAWKCRNHTRWARNFSTEKLRKMLVLARDTEQAMKTGAAEQREAFERWALEFLS